MPLVRKPADRSRASNPEPAAVLKALSSDSHDERWAAARAAADVTGGAAALGHALQRENDARVREAMFTSLARIDSTESVDELLSLLRSDNAHLRTGALDALGIMIGNRRELLARLLNDGDADVRILSCELARSLPSEAATSLLCTLLADEQQINVCAAAIDVLAEVGGPEALETLARCAQKFRETPFLSFSIKIATDRINAQAAQTRG